MIKKSKIHICALLILCVPFLVAAKTTTWIGVDFMANWNNAGNWDNGIPVNGDVVKFHPSSLGTSFMDIPNLTLSELDMSQAFSTNLTMVAGNLVVTGDLITSSEFNVGTQNITVNGNLSINNAGTIKVANGANFSIAGVVSGNGRIEQSGGIIRFSNVNVDLSALSFFEASAGTLDINGAGNQTVIVHNDIDFFDLKLSSGGMKTINGPLNVQQDLLMESGTSANINTSAEVGRDLIGQGSFMNASASSLVEIGRNLNIGAYTPGAFLKFIGTDDANWYRAGGSNYGNVEITGDKTVSLSPSFGPLPWNSGNLTVHGGSTLDINGNYLETSNMKVGGLTHGTITNTIHVARGIIIKGNVDLGSKAFIPQFGGFGLASRIGWTITQPGDLIVNGDSTILESLAINTGGTVNGYGKFIIGNGGGNGGPICGGLCLNGGELIWDASDIETAGSIGLFGNFTMSPSNTLTIKNTTAPSSFYPGGNVIAGNLIIAGSQLVKMGVDIATGTTTPINVILGKDLIIENGATIKNEESELTVHGDVFNSGTIEIDFTLTIHDSLINNGTLNISEDQQVIVKGGN